MTRFISTKNARVPQALTAVRFASNFALSTLLLTVLVSSAISQSSDTGFSITEKTEKVKGGKITTVSVEDMPIDAPGDNSPPIIMHSFFTYGHDGDKRSVLPVVMMGLTSRAVESRFPDKPDVAFILDGTRLKLNSEFEESKRDEGLAMTFAEPGVEWLDLMIPRGMFTKIVQATSVELRVNSLTLHFNDRHLKALRELDSQMRLVESKSN